MKGKIVFILVIVILTALSLISFKSNKTPSTPTAIEPTPEQEIATSSANTLGTTSMPSNQPSTPPRPTSNPQVMHIDSNKNYTATLKTTAGEVVIALNTKATPVTVNNFVTLARNAFYNNTIFHRIIKGFMIQGGDPKGDGTGGPGYRFDDEPFDGEYTRGTVAMANAGPNTNGSQFFIMHADYALPKNYVIFGKVTQGMDVVDKIATAPVSAGPSGEESKPVNTVSVTSIEISKK